MYLVHFQNNQVTFQKPSFRPYFKSVFVTGDPFIIKALERSSKVTLNQQSPAGVLHFYTSTNRPVFGLYTRIPFNHPRKPIEDISCSDILQLTQYIKCISFRYWIWNSGSDQAIWLELAFVDRDKRKAAQAIKLNFPYQGNSSKAKHSFVHFPALKLAAPAPPLTLASTQEQDSVMDIEEPVWYLDHEHLGAEVADDNPLVLSMCALNTPWSNLHLRVLAAMNLQNLSIPAEIDFQFFSVLHPVSAFNSSRPNIHPATPTPNYSRQALGTSTKTNLPPKTVGSGKRAKAPNGTKILLEKLRQLQLDSPDYRFVSY
jgi:hypothetical protein